MRVYDFIQQVLKITSKTAALIVVTVVPTAFIFEPLIYKWFFGCHGQEFAFFKECELGSFALTIANTHTYLFILSLFLILPLLFFLFILNLILNKFIK